MNHCVNDSKLNDEAKEEILKKDSAGFLQWRRDLNTLETQR